MGKLALRYGAIAALVISIVLFAPWFIWGFDPGAMAMGEVVGYSGMVLAMTAVIFAMRRERAERGALPYSRGVAIGGAVSGVAGVLFGVVTWAMVAANADTLAPALYEFYAKGIRESGATPEEMATRLAELEQMRPMFSNAPFHGAVMAATVFMIGVVLSLIGAAFLRRPASP